MKRVHYKSKNLLPEGDNSFFLEQILFQKNLSAQKSKQEVTILVFLVKLVVIYQLYLDPFIYMKLHVFEMSKRRKRVFALPLHLDIINK